MLDGVVIDDAELFNEKLQEWEHFYNYARPHGGLGGLTPYERLRQKTAPDVTRLNQLHTPCRYMRAHLFPDAMERVVDALEATYQGALTACRRPESDPRVVPLGAAGVDHVL